MNWLIKLFVTKSRIKGCINEVIRTAANAAKGGNPEKLSSIAGKGETILALGSTVCEVVKDGEYTREEEAILDPYVDKAADAIMGLIK